MQRLNPIGGGAKQPSGKPNKTNSKVGISNFNDGISRYSSQKDLYDASNARPHHNGSTSQSDDDDDDNELEQTIWDNLKKQKMPIFNMIGMGFKYLVLGLLYPFYFIFYVAPKAILSFLGNIFGKIKPTLATISRKFKEIKLAILSKMPTKQGMLRFFRIPQIKNALSALYRKISAINLAIKNKIAQLLLPPSNAIKNTFRRIAASISKFFGIVKQKNHQFHLKLAIKTTAAIQYLQKLFEKSKEFFLSQKNRLTNLWKTKKNAQETLEIKPSRWENSKKSLSNQHQKFSGSVKGLFQKTKQSINSFLKSPKTATANVCKKAFSSVRHLYGRSINRLSTLFQNIGNRTSKTLQPIATSGTKLSQKAFAGAKSAGSQAKRPFSSLSTMTSRSAKRFMLTMSNLKFLISRPRLLIKTVGASISSFGASIKSVPSKINQLTSSAWNNTSWIKKRGRILFAWMKLTPRYFMHLIDEVVTDMTKAKDKS